MNKTVWKIFFYFVVSAVAVAIVLLVVNFFALALTASDSSNLYGKSPRRELDEISENLVWDGTAYQCSVGDEYFAKKDIWCILINESGDVVWEHGKPAEVASHFTINDVANMTRWYVNDYPVYVRTRPDGLLVLGLPKNSVGKYFIDYSMEWFHTLPERAMGVLLLNAIAAALLAALFGIYLYRRLRVLMTGINGLKREIPVHLRTRGIFKEIAGSINETSLAIQRKNDALKKRDDARANWVAGISHDIRTPLSIIMGNAEELADDASLPEPQAKRAAVITAQSVRIKKLIEDLNLISSLEYDMQPVRRSEIKLCGLLRRVVSDLLNSGLSDDYTIEMDLQFEKAAVSGDAPLLERAFYNILHNSIAHNPGGCTIRIQEQRGKEAGQCVVCIADDGAGADGETLAHLDTIPKSAHGLGLPMAYRIVQVHGGYLTAENDNGLRITIVLPTVNES